MMRLLFIVLLVVPLCAVGDLSCRFAQKYTTEEILLNGTARREFLSEFVAHEVIFARSVGVDRRGTGMTVNGHRLDVDSGLLFGAPDGFSAPSKECIHVALLAHSLDVATSNAGPSSSESHLSSSVYTTDEAINLLERKVSSYERFFEEFPGFGGFFPWVEVSETGSGWRPAWDWANRVPALDNGELFWAAVAVSEVLKGYPSHAALQRRWEAVWVNMTRNAEKIFYGGNGVVRDVASMTNQSLPVAQNNYSGAGGRLDDPYEGELFTWIFQFFTELPVSEKAKLWEVKRRKLQEATLHIAEGNVSIAAQRGWWFSSHEQWKYLMLPYTLSETNRRVFVNGERARTWYAWALRTPGMWASVNGPVHSNSESFPYYSACGITPLAFQPAPHIDVLTPYSVFPLFLAGQQPHGAAWLHAMLLAPRAQNCYGSTEAWNATGSAVSPLLTWDSKATTLLALLGGVTELCSALLKRMGLLDTFVRIVDEEWGRVFALPLQGEDAPFRAPRSRTPQRLQDFSSCSVSSPQCTYPFSTPLPTTTAPTTVTTTATAAPTVPPSLESAGKIGIIIVAVVGGLMAVAGIIALCVRQCRSAADNEDSTAAGLARGML